MFWKSTADSLYTQIQSAEKELDTQERLRGLNDRDLQTRDEEVERLKGVIISLATQFVETENAEKHDWYENAFILSLG